jgi:type VI secretion system protein ImpK
MMSDLDKSLDALIVEICSPIFSLLAPLQIPEQADVASEQLRDSVEKSFVMLERRCFECQLAPEVTKDIKFAMAAFSDEVVLNSRWQKKYEWMAKPLAIEYFGDSAIGQNFFTRLDELRKEAEPSQDVLQLYFSVLLLGFQGKYRLEGYDQLQAYISTFRSEIEKYSSKASRVLAENASPESQMSSRIASGQPYWVMAVLLIAAVLGMTYQYSQKVQSAIAESAHTIQILAGPEQRMLEPTPMPVIETEDSEEATQL